MPRETAKAKKKTQPKRVGKLTDKQEAFAQHYAIHQNATAAYKHAYDAEGMSDEAIGVEAHRVVYNPKVSLRIDRYRTKITDIAEKKFDVSAERLIQELAAIAFANPKDYYKWGVRTVTKHTKDGSAYEVSEQFVEVKSSDELTAVQAKAIAGAEMTLSRTGDPVISVKISSKAQAIKQLAELTGAKAPEKVDVTIRSDDQADALIRSIEEIAIERAKAGHATH